ncbi:hypothetical protein B0T25DRAFT_529900 [Lasiosphaeria hispida]|uniref:Uncharacterized protein n=1 Tax=Lasiosphaeria hispida TaxID=260671 RepID=A0AAJ0ML29_9PEZI|nr:hypothetical protein B0T25DRAFT_529900 [Lasiosphaeria hispida]
MSQAPAIGAAAYPASTISRQEVLQAARQQPKLTALASVLMQKQLVRDVYFTRDWRGQVRQIDYNKPGNVEAVLMQAVGDVAAKPCLKCSKGQGKLARDCVMVDGIAHCANCHYGGEGARCSFRGGPRQQGSRKRKLAEQHHLNTASSAPAAMLGSSISSSPLPTSGGLALPASALAAPQTYGGTYGDSSFLTPKPGTLHMPDGIAHTLSYCPVPTLSNPFYPPLLDGTEHPHRAMAR